MYKYPYHCDTPAANLREEIPLRDLNGRYHSWPCESSAISGKILPTNPLDNEGHYHLVVEAKVEMADVLEMPVSLVSLEQLEGTQEATTRDTADD